MLNTSQKHTYSNTYLGILFDLLALRSHPVRGHLGTQAIQCRHDLHSVSQSSSQYAVVCPWQRGHIQGWYVDLIARSSPLRISMALGPNRRACGTDA
jgi:hypothetical protein